MKKHWNRLKSLALVSWCMQKITWLNQFSFMPVLWLSLLAAVLTYGATLLSIPVTWRVGIVFLIFMNVIAYFIGTVISNRDLKWYWLFVYPLLFALIILSHYAKYNLMLVGMIFILELLGTMKGNLYRK